MTIFLFYRIGWKLVMLGDETWIKLFPKLFTRQDGVSSFYVKDTVGVDLNVSRHLDVELAAEDWDFLILHYLGLDHVGHIGGRQSILMAPKLKEMDEVIKMIHVRNILYQGNATSRTLLVVVSDHGMTDGGNHGGSSYEETDSLLLFIGLGSKGSNYSPYAHKAFQVDIAPTLALLFGVPIPKNNIGVMLPKMLDSLTDEQKLRALELNAWQLLRLLQAHLPGLLCGDLRCGGDGQSLQINGSTGRIKEKFCHLFSKATAAHNMWQLRQGSSFTSNTDDLRIAVESYYDFLRSASEWLSRRATDKPINLLLSGIAIMLISCFLLLILLFFLLREVYFTQTESCSQLKESRRSCHIDEIFVFIGIIIHVLSFTSSSMVEEEQYTWHFLTSTLHLLFLFSAIQLLFKRQASKRREEELTPHQSCISVASSIPMINNENYKISSVLVVLFCARVLRGWHQGGVNWVHLPDVSKLLVQAGSFIIKVLHIISLLIVMMPSLFALSIVRLKRGFVFLVSLSHFVSGFLVLLHIIENQSDNMVPINQSAASIAQIFYINIGSTVMLTVLASPWVVPIPCQETHMMTQTSLNCHSTNMRSDSLLLGFQDCTYMIGTTYVASWCLLQLLLQQPINAIPVLLIFLQLLACMIYFSIDGSHHKQCVEVASIYFLGMAGHFGLGNSNSLATIDVAGAFIGISSYSTVLSGILMFMITYASPMLSFLSMVMYISMKNTRYFSLPNKSKWSCMLEMKLAFPCLLPLVLNSVVLTAFTIILLLMRNHLFVWSVFSPKYLYICAATVCVYIGVFIIATTGFYTSIVLSFRTKRLKPEVHNFLFKFQ
ncbi:GPI ethanolamine phosphate transferase 2 isoform X5 [Phoenix dactylifera]|uniref:GPI ethanolamine phosphate transferase 2 isoform X5 n=1 Tax=Phoenix dactylifera TaxID=42345 RepID=A0A8B8J025_PHODC|nr:GPI ethanolamine phosphate transferase 2 isoform X5 [Phoenix dactylifera]